MTIFVRTGTQFFIHCLKLAKIILKLPSECLSISVDCGMDQPITNFKDISVLKLRYKTVLSISDIFYESICVITNVIIIVDCVSLQFCRH